MIAGTVSAYDPDEGFGVIRLEDGRDAWFHFSSVAEPEWTVFKAGDPIAGTFEDVEQDGYHVRAVEIFRAR